MSEFTAWNALFSFVEVNGFLDTSTLSALYVCKFGMMRIWWHF